MSNTSSSTSNRRSHVIINRNRTRFDLKRRIIRVGIESDEFLSFVVAVEVAVGAAVNTDGGSVKR